MRLIEESTFGSLSIASNLASCNYAKFGGLFVYKFILTFGNLLTLVTDEFGINYILSSLPNKLRFLTKWYWLELKATS